ncbi:MAG: Asp23/Gls24 family envelope stress response protein [Pseudonocardiaceae bacterium]
MTSVSYPGQAATDRRGETTIADRAVERLAAHAITELTGVGGAAPRMLGFAVVREEIERSAKVSAHVRGGAASLVVRLSIAYPASVRKTTELVREHVVRRTREMSGLDVDRVDITVIALHSDHVRRRRVV